MSDEQNPQQPAAPEAPAPAPAGGGGGDKPYASDDGIMLFLAYFGLLSLIPFLMFKDKRSDPKKEYVYWHARQGLTFLIACMVIFIPLSILSVIPFVGCLISILLLIAGLAMFGLNILLWVKAFGGERWVIPVVGKFAEKLG